MLGDKSEIETEWQRLGAEQSRKTFDRDDLLNRDPEFKALGTPSERAAHAAKLKRRFDDLKAQIKETEDRAFAVRQEQADLGGAALADVPVLRAQIQDLEPEIARLERKADALQIAIEELESAVSHFRDHCLGDVMVDTSSFLQAITDGRYSAVEIKSDDLVPTVVTPERLIPTDLLSRGVQDQLYFALRVALARAITRGHTLPLVLDDPFVNFDPMRRERVLMLLSGLVDRTQVILFTCDPWYGEHITPVLELSPAGAITSSKAADVA